MYRNRVSWVKGVDFLHCCYRRKNAMILDEARWDSSQACNRSRTDVIVSNIVEVDELEKERRGQIVAGTREHGLIAKTS